MIFIDALYEFIFTALLESWNGFLEKRGSKKVADKNNVFIKISTIILMNLIAILGAILLIFLFGWVYYTIRKLF